MKRLIIPILSVTLVFAPIQAAYAAPKAKQEYQIKAGDTTINGGWLQVVKKYYRGDTGKHYYVSLKGEDGNIRLHRFYDIKVMDKIVEGKTYFFKTVHVTREGITQLWVLDIVD